MYADSFEAFEIRFHSGMETVFVIGTLIRKCAIEEIDTCTIEVEYT